MSISPNSTGIPEQLYPLTTQDGQSIPNDVIKPTFFLPMTASSGSFQTADLPSDTDLLVIYSEADIIVAWEIEDISFPLLNGTVYSKMLFIPAFHATVCTVLGDKISVALRASTGNAAAVNVQGIQRWEALALPRQAARR